MIDLAKFKAVNDTYGHAAGDAVLTAVASRFAALLQPCQFIARIGGDEFVALIPARDRDQLDTTLSRLRFAVDMPFSFGSFSVTCGAGIGIAWAPNDGTEAADLLKKADLALYRAKRAEPAETCRFCPALDDAQRLRRDLGTHLRTAIASGQLGLTFVPSHTLPERTVAGYAAVPHWDHPTLGLLRSEMLFALAEESAVSLPLGSWMLNEACSTAAAWDDPLPISVTITPLLLADHALADAVADALEETGLAAHRLCLALTEESLLRDRDRTLHRLQMLRSLGVGLVLDEFGAGSCSLDAMRAFPFDRLKLHSSVFAVDPSRPQQLPILLAGLASFGRLLELPVTAQGADTPEQVRLALDAGCDAVQGLALGKLSATELPTIPRPVATFALRQRAPAHCV